MSSQNYSHNSYCKNYSVLYCKEGPSRKELYKNKKTGDEIEWHPGKRDPNDNTRIPGREGKDHWHRHNPNRPEKPKKLKQQRYYLDKDGNAVPRGSRPSHLYPKDQSPNIFMKIKNWFEDKFKREDNNKQEEKWDYSA